MEGKKNFFEKWPFWGGLPAYLLREKRSKNVFYKYYSHIKNSGGDAYEGIKLTVNKITPKGRKEESNMTEEEKKLLQAKHRLEEAQARDRVKERKARTRRLIQEGAILERCSRGRREQTILYYSNRSCMRSQSIPFKGALTHHRRWCSALCEANMKASFHTKNCTYSKKKRGEKSLQFII